MKSAKPLLALTALLAVCGAVFVLKAVSATGIIAPADPTYVKAAQILAHGKPERLALRSQVALVLDEREGVVLYERAAGTPRPIASLTKLMTALVVLESGAALDEKLVITQEDRDRLKGSHSRIAFGGVFTRGDLLRAALGASDNRAASALARAFRPRMGLHSLMAEVPETQEQFSGPGGRAAFIAAMNAKAQALGMTSSRFVDASGLGAGNVSTARDLRKLLDAAHSQTLIHDFTTLGEFYITDLVTHRSTPFVNTNRLVRQERWEIALSKTGYTADAGYCLAMQTTVAGRPISIVLLNSWGKASKYGDAQRIRDWLIDTERRIPPVTANASL